MAANQDEIAEWIADGRLRPERIHEAMRLSGHFPDGQRWRHFVDQLLLWLAIAMAGAALIFFLAHHWDAMGRYGQFALAQLTVILGLLLYWRLPENAWASRASLFLAALFVGGLLALLGQIYQTGADSYELFLAWAIAIFVWVLVARLAALWMLWLALLNLSLLNYVSVYGGLWGISLSFHRLSWAFLILNLSAWIVWESVAWRTQHTPIWRWPMRTFAALCIFLFSELAISAIFRPYERIGTLALWAIALAYPTFLVVAHEVYRRWCKDLLILTGVIASAMIVFNVWVGHRVLTHDSAASFLLMSGLIISSSAGAGLYLKKLARES